MLRSVLPLLLLLLLLAAVAPFCAAARGFNGELLRPLGIDAEHNQEALLSFDPFSVSTYSPRLSLSVANSECSDCVHSVARHIIDSALKAVADKCANVTCPVIKQRCQWIDDHQAEYTGVLAVELRPFTDGFMYCYGNGTCDHPGVPKSDISLSLLQMDSSSRPELLLSQVAAAAPFVEKVMRMEVPRKLNQSNSSDDKDEKDSDDDEQEDSRMSKLARRIAKEEKKHRSCHSCLRHGVKWVLKRSIKHLIAACKATKCDKFKHFCAWAKEHKEITKGMLYAHVQPWKAASGYCAGNGACQCGADDETKSMRGAPFTMGDKLKKHHDEEHKQKEKPVIGGGKHDKMPHGDRHPNGIAEKVANFIAHKLEN